MGHQGFQSREGTLKRWKSKQKSLGLCVACSSKAKYNRIRCEYHLEQEKKYQCSHKKG